MTQRIKVTVMVDDNGTLYTGSAVQQWTCTATNNAMGGMAIGGCALKAEAVPVKVGDKGWVFMILSSHECCAPDEYTGAIQKGRSKEDQSLPWNVPLDQAPPFVRFADLNDRLTVELMDSGNFSRSLGGDVSLNTIRAEVSTERLTKGKIRKLLPWAKPLGGRSFDETVPNEPDMLMREITGINFEWGL